VTSFKRIGVALALSFLLAPAAVANPKNALDAYAAKPDPTFGWRIDHAISGPGYHGAVLAMTSQTWLDASKVDKPVWTHWLTVIVPDEVHYAKAMLYIDGGTNTDPAPAKPIPYFAKMAVETHSVVADLTDVPNQPLRFAEQPDKPRVEDQIIAYQQSKFVKDHDPQELLRLPMVKSGSAAMTAVQQYLASAAGGPLKIDGFVVAGASKRGWTTWLVGATDPRVVAIIPMVINVLDFDATVRHHWEALGYFSPAVKDYIDAGLIPAEIGKPGMDAINRIEDPLNYRDRPAMRMPKYVIDAVGDQFFPPDDTQFGYHKLAQIKRLRMIPNADHSMAGTDVIDSVTAFYAAVLDHRPLPAYSWTLRKDGAIVVHASGKPLEVNLWQGTDPKARDFRVATLGKAFTATKLTPAKDGTYVGKVAKPDTGYTAYFVELVYPSGTAYPLKFTTEVSVTPNILPYKWADARPITEPDGK
jgi:PhoPQ-activated pathogenicity-related protein